MEESETNTMPINPPNATTIYDIKARIEADNINAAAFDSPTLFLQSPPGPDLNVNPRKTSDVITPMTGGVTPDLNTPTDPVSSVDI